MLSQYYSTIMHVRNTLCAAIYRGEEYEQTLIVLLLIVSRLVNSALSRKMIYRNTDRNRETTQRPLYHWNQFR